MSGEYSYHGKSRAVFLAAVMVFSVVAVAVVFGGGAMATPPTNEDSNDGAMGTPTTNVDPGGTPMSMPTTNVDAPSVVTTGEQETVTVTGTAVAEARVSGETAGWVVEDTSPADSATFPGPGDTPYESSAGDTWIHRFDSESDENAFDVTLTAPDTAGTYEFRAVVANASGATATRVFSVEVSAPATAQASVALGDQSVGDGSGVVTVSSVTAPDGGFVTLHEGSAGGPVVGVSEHLSAGQHSGVRVALDGTVSDGTTLVAMAHTDSDGDGEFDFDPGDGETADGPYTVESAPVTDSAMLTVESTTSPVPGVSRQVVTAAAGGDGSIDRSDVLAVMRAYSRGDALNGVRLTRSEVLSLLEYYVTT